MPTRPPTSPPNVITAPHALVHNHSSVLTSATTHVRAVRTMRLLLFAFVAAHAAPSRIVFPDDHRQERRLEPITPPVLPVIPHLENDPTAERVGQRSGLDVSPNSDGGLTASFGHGFAGLGGGSQTAAHSVSFGFNGGFQASQSSSSSNAFDNAAHGGISSTQANSQSASFAVGSGGVSAASAAASASAAGQASAHSQSASFGVNAPGFGGNSPSFATGSQSASSAFATGNRFPNSVGTFVRQPPNYRPNSYSGSPGFSSGRPGFARPNFGEGSIDIRTRPVSGPKTPIVFPGGLSRDSDDDDDSDELFSFDDRWLTGGRKGGLAKWLSILVSD